MAFIALKKDKKIGGYLPLKIYNPDQETIDINCENDDLIELISKFYIKMSNRNNDQSNQEKKFSETRSGFSQMTVECFTKSYDLSMVLLGYTNEDLFEWMQKVDQSFELHMLKTKKLVVQESVDEKGTIIKKEVTETTERDCNFTNIGKIISGIISNQRKCYVDISNNLVPKGDPQEQEKLELIISELETPNNELQETVKTSYINWFTKRCGSNIDLMNYFTQDLDSIINIIIKQLKNRIRKKNGSKLSEIELYQIEGAKKVIKKHLR